MAIYLARNQGCYKIGYSNDPVKRLAELQVGNPSRIELVGTVSGTIVEEKKLHDLFKGKRVSGEWFALSDEDVESILSSSPKLAVFTARVRRGRRCHPGKGLNGEDIWLSPDEEATLLQYFRLLREEASCAA